MNLQAINDLTIAASPEMRAPVQETRAAETPEERATRESAPRIEPSSQEVENAVEGLNSVLQSNASHIQFAVHEKAKEMMVQVIDDQTEEVIKTIPPKELLDLAAKIGELVGTLLDKRG